MELEPKRDSGFTRTHTPPPWHTHTYIYTPETPCTFHMYPPTSHSPTRRKMANKNKVSTPCTLLEMCSGDILHELVHNSTRKSESHELIRAESGTNSCSISVSPLYLISFLTVHGGRSCKTYMYVYIYIYIYIYMWGVEERERER